MCLIYAFFIKYRRTKARLEYELGEARDGIGKVVDVEGATSNNDSRRRKYNELAEIWIIKF